MTVALLVNMLYSVVDRIYLGHIPGEGRLALTGIGLAFPIIAVISAFQRLCSDGGAPLCAMARGAGELERAETIQGNAYTLLLLFSLLRKVILVIPLVYLLPKLLPWGAIAVFLSEPISDLIGGTASYLAMRASVWKELCRLEAHPPSEGPASDPV